MNTDPKKIALLTGAGAIKNAWNPICRALQPFYAFPITPESANSIFARMVYLLRYFSSDYYLSTADGQINLKARLDHLKEVKTSIAKELKIARENNELSVRDEFTKIMESFVITKAMKIHHITTNWDAICGRKLSSLINRTHIGDLPILYLHGEIASPSNLYLPTEMVEEPYRQDDEQTMLGTAHGHTWRVLEQADRIVIYGLSISPLDAELLQIIACGLDYSIKKEVFIIDPFHEQVAERLKPLINPNRQEVKVFGFSPSDLSNHTTYLMDK